MGKVKIIGHSLFCMCFYAHGKVLQARSRAEREVRTPDFSHRYRSRQLGFLGRPFMDRRLYTNVYTTSVEGLKGRVPGVVGRKLDLLAARSPPARVTRGHTAEPHRKHRTPDAALHAVTEARSHTQPARKPTRFRLASPLHTLRDRWRTTSTHPWAGILHLLFLLPTIGVLHLN